MGRNDWDEGVIVEDDSPRTRPFVVTGGKTSSDASVRIETLVEAGAAHASARFEKGDLLALTTGGAISVAELSSHLSLPIGTTMTLISEMLDDGLLTAHATVEETSSVANLDIMSRIIKRVQEL